MGSVPVDECIIQLELKHKVPQTVLDDCFRLISTIGAGRQHAEGIRGASVHGPAKVVDEETVHNRKGDFLVLGGNANASRRVSSHALSGSA